MYILNAMINKPAKAMVCDTPYMYLSVKWVMDSDIMGTEDGSLTQVYFPYKISYYFSENMLSLSFVAGGKRYL